jgi:hypothetical protein
MPLTRVEGDFSQVSNIVQVTIPPVPEVTLQILIGWMSGQTFLIPADLSSATESGTVDPSLGYINGYEVNEDSSIVGAYGAYGEGASAGASRSADFSDTWASDSFPIYSSAPPRHSRVAFGLGTFIHAGTRNTGETRAALSTDFGIESFSWSSDGGAIQDGIGVSGCAGIDYVDGFFYAYGNDGDIGQSLDGIEWFPVATGMPSQTFNSSTRLPYARFAGQGNTIVAMFCARIVVSTDGGASFVADFADAFTDANEVGGAGVNEPYMSGLAHGGGAWVAVGNIGTSTNEGEGPGLVGDPRIRRSTVGAETPWADVAIPVTNPAITQMLDVVYDTDGDRFLALGRTAVSAVPASGGTVVFTAFQIDGAGGVDPQGVITFTMDDFIGAPTTALPSGNLESGTLAGYSELGIATFSGSGNEWVVALRVPIADWRVNAQFAYWTSVEIIPNGETPEITSGPVFNSDASTFSETPDEAFEFVTLKWGFFGLISNRMGSGDVYTATFTPVDGMLPVVTSNVFHVLQSTDGGATFTAELQQVYDGAGFKDKGWIKLLLTPPASFNLLQEDDFLVQQEDDFAILIQSEAAGTAPVLTQASQSGTFNDLAWDAAVPVLPGVTTTYDIYRVSAQELDGSPNFSTPIENISVGSMSLLTTVDGAVLVYLDTDANNLIEQYCYLVRAITTTGELDSNKLFSSAVS